MSPKPPEIIIVAVTTLDRPSTRADRQVDAGGDDDEGHADGDDAGLRHGAHDVGDVVGREEQDLAVPARREDDAADHHDDQADQALEAHDQRQRIAMPGAAAAGAGLPSEVFCSDIRPPCRLPRRAPCARRRRR